MKHNFKNPRPLEPKMGKAIADRTVLRGKETWKQLANRVARGNCALSARLERKELSRFRDHIANGSILLSGRHLQHGDIDQPKRNQEVFTNCSTAVTSFLKYYLLLNGSGVGRCYDDDLMVVDWSLMPFIHCVIDEDHADFDHKIHESLAQAKHKYGHSDVIHFEVGDSREGWARLIEYIEYITFQGTNFDKILLADFSKVRPRGAKIKGMQNRPSSGPVPLMNAINAISTLKGSLIPKWKQAMYVDHYLAECVLVGGARRSARIAVKNWRDPEILDFIYLKSVKFNGSVPLWSSNNSVAVDKVFWREVSVEGSWANKVFNAVCDAAYNHGTGEPGFVNVDRLEQSEGGMSKLIQSFQNHSALGSKKYEITSGYQVLTKLANIVHSKRYKMIPNPCGEISLNMLGAYCVIGDVVPFYCDTQEEFEEACKLTTRALMRTNLMPCVYQEEVLRTNRIGVSLTGLHEYAWKRFKFGFRDLLDERKSHAFWFSLSQARDAILNETRSYAHELGTVVPHSCLTIKPAGTTSKLFGLSEGAHLPSMKEYVRWVQFRHDSPQVEKYRKLGYKVKTVKSYSGTVIIGFPTQPVICQLGMGNQLLTASEATPAEQFKWLQLLEKHWLGSVRSNQISYTLKYDRKKVSFKNFKKMMSKYMPTIKCCSVMPFTDKTSYEYQPEEAVTLDEYDAYVKSITSEEKGDIDVESLKCSSGICPVDIK